MATERPLSSVLSDIMGNVQHIMRSEVRLARTEITREAGKALSASVLTGAGILMLTLSGLFLLVAIVAALSLLMPVWAAALIVAAGEGLMAAIFVSAGVRRFKALRGTPRTAVTLKENVEWVSHPTN